MKRIFTGFGDNPQWHSPHFSERQFPYVTLREKREGKREGRAGKSRQKGGKRTEYVLHNYLRGRDTV
jgi:hypothetical protein